MIAPDPAAPPAAASVWLEQPSPEQVRRAEGLYAPVNTREGRARMRCLVQPDGRLDLCRVEPDRGTDPAFSEALVKLAPLYRHRPGAAGVQTDVEVVFPKLVDADARPRGRPTPQQLLALNPKGRRGAMHLACTVDVQGALTRCSPDPDPDDDPEMSAAALAAAPLYRFEPARREGRPVENLHRLEIGFKGPHDTDPDWIRKPNMAQLNAAWPRAALQARQEGGAVVVCRVTTGGALADCRVRSETPTGYGFGAAALLLTPNFQMKPATHDGAPVSSQVSIPIKFSGVPPAVSTPQLAAFHVLEWAPWERAPGLDDVRRAFPPQALARHAFGAAMFRCEVKRDGSLYGCDLTQETTTGLGLEAGARKLLPLFRMRLSPDAVSALSGVRVLVAVKFTPRALDPAAAPAWASAPDWVRGPEPADVKAAFPAEARAAHVATGRATLECVIGDDGGLSECRTQGETPPALGFGPAALKVAAAMRANLWSRDGEPLAGEHVRLPLRLVDEIAPAASASAEAPGR